MSKWTTQEVVRGINLMEYNIDGKEVLSMAVHIDVELDPAKGGKGYRTEPKRALSQEVVESIKHNPFPMLAEVSYQALAGKKQGQVDIVVTGIVPKATEPAARSAPAK